VNAQADKWAWRLHWMWGSHWSIESRIVNPRHQYSLE